MLPHPWHRVRGWAARPQTRGTCAATAPSDGPAHTGPPRPPRSQLRLFAEPHNQQCVPRPSGDRGACSDLQPRRRALAWWQVWPQEQLSWKKTKLYWKLFKGLGGD